MFVSMLVSIPILGMQILTICLNTAEFKIGIFIIFTMKTLRFCFISLNPQGHKPIPKYDNYLIQIGNETEGIYLNQSFWFVYNFLNIGR